MTVNDEDLMAWINSFPPTKETLERLEELDLLALDRNPEFVADLLKGMVTEDIMRAMEDNGINRNQLAKKMGKSRQYIGRVLSEKANFTLERLAALACALDRDIAVRMFRRDETLAIRDLPDYGLSDHLFQPLEKQKAIAKKIAKKSSSDDDSQHPKYNAKTDADITSEGTANEKFQLAA